MECLKRFLWEVSMTEGDSTELLRLIMLPTGVGEVIEISGMSSDSGQAALGTRPYSSSNSLKQCCLDYV